jgi:hypothetical protein
MNDHLLERELLEAARAGVEEAVELLVKRYITVVSLFVALKWEHEPLWIPSVVEKIFGKVLSFLPYGERYINFGGMLYAVASQVCAQASHNLDAPPPAMALFSYTPEMKATLAGTRNLPSNLQLPALTAYMSPEYAERVSAFLSLSKEDFEILKTHGTKLLDQNLALAGFTEQEKFKIQELFKIFEYHQEQLAQFMEEWRQKKIPTRWELLWRFFWHFSGWCLFILAMLSLFLFFHLPQEAKLALPLFIGISLFILAFLPILKAVAVWERSHAQKKWQRVHSYQAGQSGTS